ncbi:receptor activity-modifying protein 3-like isoform X1 [Channa argus]|uniref:receptor activity-modifying protein 3-like isoform X1 n=2 Tax=Channa argus TaxID=215402 RepID=UPI003522507A
MAKTNIKALSLQERPWKLVPTMIPYLLIPVLIIHGVMESQSANMTEEQLGKAERNHTLDISQMYNTTRKPEYMTSSLYKDKKTQVEDELQKNQTSVVTEDNENFQDWENWFSAKTCSRDELKNNSQVYCVANFHKEMQKISKDNWCVMENIIRPYFAMTNCLEGLCYLLSCYYPNPEIEDVFINIHSSYFKNCTKEELLIDDAPQALVIILTLIPVSLIPAMVYLVVWKSKFQD